MSIQARQTPHPDHETMIYARAAQIPPTGYLVIKELAIKNFRCFEEQRLADLRRINVIVGENGSGKTSLLEALFLLGGNSAEITLRLRSQRGMGDVVSVNYERQLLDEIWRDFFHDLDIDNPITVSAVDSESASHNRSVTIGRPISEMGTLVPLNGRPSKVLPMQFTWTQGEQAATVDVRLTADGLLFGMSKLDPLPVLYFYSTVSTAAPSEAATRYSKLSVENREDDFLAAIRSVFPTVRRVSVETNAGTTMLYAQVHGVSRKIPITSVSQGVNKLVQYLLGLMTYRNGFAMIDELEAGIYYEKLPLVWQALLSTARQTDMQIFVTTHSRECLEALRDLIAGNEGEFSLIRAERIKAGGCELKHFTGDKFAAALNQEIEVR